MSRLQALIISLLLFTIPEMTFANSCRPFHFQGFVRSQGDEIRLIIYERSRSETLVQVPKHMQEVLRQHLDHRIELNAPAEKLNTYTYQVYFKQGQVNYYPFTNQMHDTIVVTDPFKEITCEGN